MYLYSEVLTVQIWSLTICQKCILATNITFIWTSPNVTSRSEQKNEKNEKKKKKQLTSSVQYLCIVNLLCARVVNIIICVVDNISMIYEFNGHHRLITMILPNRPPSTSIQIIPSLHFIRYILKINHRRSLLFYEVVGHIILFRDIIHRGIKKMLKKLHCVDTRIRQCLYSQLFIEFNIQWSYIERSNTIWKIVINSDRYWLCRVMYIRCYGH